MNRVKIVAEIGCNHNGSFIKAKEMISAAKECGADAVKFQTFNSSKLVTNNAPKAEYQIANTNDNGSQLSMLKKLELSQDEYIELKKYAESIGIEMFSTAFDMDSIDFLYKYGQNIWKIPSGEITNLPYLRRISELKCKNKEIILSTGMSTIDEIMMATNILEKSENTKFTILHCNTDYPTKDEDVNLLALIDLKEKFSNWNIGLSDHSVGTLAATISIGLGAKFVEKHFTLNKDDIGPDHAASITPDELKKLCYEIRRAEIMLGTKEKHVTKSEYKNISVVRKSIVANRNIKKGEKFTEDNLTGKRPGTGISMIYWYELIGKYAEKDFEKDEFITHDGFTWENGNE